MPKSFYISIRNTYSYLLIYKLFISQLKMWLNKHIHYMVNILWNNVIYNYMSKISYNFYQFVRFF